MNLSVGLDSAAHILDGKLAVDQKAPEYMSVADTTAKVKMRYDLAAGSYVIATDVKVENSESRVLTISRRAEQNQKLHPQDLAGFEARFDISKKNECEMIQNVAIFRNGTGEIKRVVFDKKYCDKVRDILGQHGNYQAAKAELKVCNDLLANVQKAFNERKAELAKENTIMSDSIGPLASPVVGRDEQSAAGLMLGLMNVCTPKDWLQTKTQIMQEKVASISDKSTKSKSGTITF